MTELQQAETVHQLLKDIRVFTAIVGESLYEIGRRFRQLKQMRAHKLMGFSRWGEFIHAYTNYERAWVDSLIQVVEKYAAVIDSATAVAVPISRLRDALPYVKSDNDAVTWYHRAAVLPARGWQDALREARGAITADNCDHPEVEMVGKCKICRAWLGQIVSTSPE